MDKFRIDGEKLSLHPHRVAQWLDGKNEWETAKSIYPLYCEISPIGVCSHFCTFCAVDTLLEANKKAKKAPKLATSLIKERLAEMASLGVRSIMAAGAGEPMLHPNMVEIAESAHLSGLDVAFTTNGVALKEALLPISSWIKISMNGGSAENYARIHRTKEKDFERVWANIANAVMLKKRHRLPCDIGVQAVLLPENDAEMLSLAQRCKDTGVQYFVVKPYSQGLFSINKMTVTYDHYQQLEDDLTALNNAAFEVIFRASSMKAVAEPIPYTTCGATSFMWCYIEADGAVYACSAYLTDHRFLLGNINDNTFQEIWEGEARRKNYEMMKSLDITKCRKSCRMHSSNIYLWNLEHAAHRSFI